MPPCYDIYGLSKQRNKETIEKFLNHFSIRERVEVQEKCEIHVSKNEKYKTEETWVSINTLTEVIDFGLANSNLGFAFYISKHLRADINYIILKFTFDGKILFGISIEERRIAANGDLIDNYDNAIGVEKTIAALTNASKTSIQFEWAPSDDEEEFDSDIELWRNMNEEKRTR